MTIKLSSTLCCMLVAVACADEAPRYAADVRPILAKNCFACHGADEATREAELRLDVEADRTDKDSVAAKAIVPDRPKESELIRRVMSTDPETRMPPPDSGHTLTDAQINTLLRWIADGARYEQHWSFVPPVRPEIPKDDTGWSETSIDSFVLHKLHEQGLNPSPRAEPHLLIRRLYLDLIGLPPTPETADAFAESPTSAAYEKIVDELLASPRFGEHWASMWLDLARYADTKGYEKDQPRNIWRYRDWVIEAFNRDLPFDQFTTEQIAGDLLENATTDQILATAFHRNTMSNDEGGTDDEEFRVAAVKDRVDTTLQVWMGLTMGCAKCHSHKYDPISQHEYYQFMAFFNQTEDADRPNDSPRLATPTQQQQKQKEDLKTQLAALRKKHEVRSPESETAQRHWEDDLGGKPQWEIPRVTKAASANGSKLTVLPDQSVLANGKLPPTDVYELILETDDFRKITAVRVEALTDESLPREGPGRNETDPNFVLSEITAAMINDDGTEVQSLSFQSAQADFSQNDWQVEKAIDGKTETGWAISPQFGKRHDAIFSLATPIDVTRGQLLQIKLSQQYQPASLLLGRVRIYVSNADPHSLHPTGALAEAAGIPRLDRKPEQQKLLDDAFRKIHPATADIAKQIESAEKQLAEIDAAVVQTPIMRDLSEKKRRETHVHVRGNFLDEGDKVNEGFPAAFAVAPFDEPNRLAVAKWLTAEQNPLTARVAVNRIWSRIFGRGIVETEEDFGTQGMQPTHPELLDWLAVEFREHHQWSLKKLCKSIVLSATYQQSAAVSDLSKEHDPESRWLSRGARFRLSAETVRDQALAVSGLLSEKIGGPSVMPPQPNGIWRATYSTLTWDTATDEDRYRRGLYTFLRRTSPYPSMITFDGTSREVCQIRRIRTNTPLQALITLNDPVFVEAAGALAKSTIALDQRDRLTEIFRQVLIRKPTERELPHLQHLYEEAFAEYENDSASAENLLKAANLSIDGKTNRDLAALTLVASVILNLDETVSRP